MIRLTRTIFSIALLALVSAVSGKAQASVGEVSTEEVSAPAPSSSEPAAWKVGSLSVSGLVDGFYSLNFNHPADHVNGLLNFDDRGNRTELNMAILKVSAAPKPVGFQLTAGGGRAFDIMGATEKAATGMRFFEEAYIDVKPAPWKGLELDFGKFGSWAGAEVIDTPDNWNYSRSLLFVWCAPYYHFGVRASVPVGKKFTTGVALVSGWSNIVTDATYRTVGLTGAWTPTAKVTWTNTYYGGPDENAANRGMRNLYDTVLQLAPSGKTTFYLNLDYLHDSPKYSPGFAVGGVAAAARFQVTRKLSLSPRLEWLDDGSGMATGTAQQVKEFTTTGTYALMDRLSLWIEFRNDWSNQPFFNRGNGIGVTQTQPTALFGMVAILRPKE